MTNIRQENYVVELCDEATISFSFGSGTIDLRPMRSISKEYREIFGPHFMITNVKVRTNPAQAAKDIRMYAKGLADLADRIEEDMEGGWIAKLNRKVCKDYK